MDLCITCIPGLEPALMQEVEALGLKGVATFGCVSVAQATFDAVYECNLLLRSASRVLIPLARFTCISKEALYEHALQIEWDLYFKNLPTFAIDATVSSPHFNNSLFAAQVVKDAICDVLRKKIGKRPDVQVRHPGIQVNLFIDNETAIISFDSSNGPLHERGYRRQQVIAPIRENLAAGLLLLAGYNETCELVDPCAGSGTFLIEAAMMATNTPPNALRKQFGFMLHPDYSEKRWLEVKSKWLQKRKPLKSQILGIERDPESFQLLEENISRAGFLDTITPLRADFRTAKLPFTPDFVISNPPYGKRLSEEKALEGLYKALGEFMKQKTKKPARGFLFTGSPHLMKKVGLRTSKRYIVMNSGIECRLLAYELYEGQSE